MPTPTGPGVLQGLAVLITGGGSGIGRATAVAATAAGARVLVCGRRESTLREVADLCDAYAFTADLNEPGEPDRVVSETVRRLGRIDGVVLNAGVLIPGSVLELTDQGWDACVATNLSAPFRVARAALPHLVATRGALVGVSSVAALRAPTSRRRLCQQQSRSVDADEYHRGGFRAGRCPLERGVPRLGANGDGR